MNEPVPRADGATRGDRIEATALIVAGLVLLCVPVLALMDELEPHWLLLSLLSAVAGLAIGGLGLRWFREEGPRLESSLAIADAAFMASEPRPTPVELRLIDAGKRFVAHCLRFIAFASAGLLMFVELGPVRWLVIAMLGTSFLADQWMLRPRRYVILDSGLQRRGMLSPIEIPWSSITTVFWRHYPGTERPPFPSGERLIFELEKGDGLEFVFRGDSASNDASSMARNLVVFLENKVRILSPRRTRPEIERQDVSKHLEASSPEVQA